MNCFKKADRSHQCRVVLLDQSEQVLDIQDSTLGRPLLEDVCRQLKLPDTIFFGLRFLNTANQPRWLDLNKKVARQLKGAEPFTLYFCVKFYVADPCKLTNEATRYQFFQQVRRDIADGRLPVSPELAAEVSAYVIQSELGDYDASQSQGNTGGYHSGLQLCAENVAAELRAEELHKTLVGMTPAAAEAALLQKVRWLEMYGVDLHPIMGEQHTDSFLGLAPAGVLVVRGKDKINNYFWPRIVKIFSKKNNFMLRVRDKESDERTLGFEAPSRASCQELLNSCLEQRDFFHRALHQPPGLTSGGRSENLGQRSSQRQRGRRAAPPGGGASAAQVEGGAAPACRTSVSVPQPVQSASDLYRSSQVSAVTGTPPDSPRSVHSAALSASQLPGMFNTSTLHKTRSRLSVDSQSSADSRTLRRHRHRRDSSVASGTSDASSGQGSTRSSRRYKGRRVESGSDSDRSASGRRHRSRRRRHQQAKEELVDSEPQWREVLRQRAERLRPSGYQNSGMETETELSYQPKRRVKKHSRSRSRSKSPESARLRHVPPELRRHLQFELVEPVSSGGDLAYTEVTTEARMPRIRYATKRSQRTSANPEDSQSDRRSETGSAAACPPPQGAPAAGVLPPTAHYPRPLPAVPAGAGPQPHSGNTLSSYYVTGGAPSSDRSRKMAAQPRPVNLHGDKANNLKIADEAPVAVISSAHVTSTGAHVTSPAGRASVTAETQWDNSDSGLGNESPIEFSRCAVDSPSLQSPNSHIAASSAVGGGVAANVTREVATSL